MQQRPCSLPLLALLAAGALTLSFGAAWADEADAEAVRRARTAGEIRPLSDLLAQVKAQCQGRFVEVELEESDGRWTYEITWLGPRGDVAELEYDANDFGLLEAEGRHLDALDCVPPGTPD